MVMARTKPKPLLKIEYRYGIRGYSCKCMWYGGWGITQDRAYAEWERNWDRQILYAFNQAVAMYSRE